MADGYIEENQQNQETFEQCDATYQMSNRDSIVTEGYVVVMFHHAAQSARIRTPERLESVNIGSLQLPVGPHRGLRRACRHGLAE
jgi:hypothetical protein